MLVSDSGPNAASQGGGALLEVLIAMFIFAIGMMGVIAAQAQGGKIVLDAQFRSEAAAAADELLARMKTADPATRRTQFETGGAAFQQWLDERLTAGRNGLPGGDATVEFGVIGGDPRTVRIVVLWEPRREREYVGTNNMRIRNQTRQHVTVSALYD